jgi:hypothetical protein
MRRRKALVCGCGLIAGFRRCSAQQPLDWDQVKAKFEAVNPALKADADNVDEMKAEEITAFLRPNPQFNFAVDGNADRAAQWGLDSLQGHY